MNLRTMHHTTSIIDVLDYAFLAVLTLLLIISFTHTPYRYTLLTCYLFLFGFLFLMGKLREKGISSQRLKLIQLIYPIVFMFAVFETFFMIIPYVNPNRFDELLIQIDLALFGVHPTVWIERFVTPWLTEIFYICYLLYFPMPLVTAVYLYQKRNWKELERMIFVFMMCYFTGYAGYFMFPASGPRFNLQELQTVNLDGLIFTDAIRSLIAVLEPNSLDAFPSLHTSILVTTLICTYRVWRQYFYWLIPLAVGIFISLVYCRYHYVIDIVAGLAWSGLSYLAATGLLQKYQDMFTPHFSPMEEP